MLITMKNVILAGVLVGFPLGALMGTQEAQETQEREKWPGQVLPQERAAQEAQERQREADALRDNLIQSIPE